MAQYVQLRNLEQMEHDEGAAYKDQNQGILHKTSRHRSLAFSFFSGVLLTAVAGVCFGFRQDEPHTEILPILTPPGSITRTLFPETSFDLGSNQSDQAWRTILPEGLGFVQHPTLGPEIVGLAFVHQLHCVDILRNSYITALNHNADEETTRHISHCIEYLRQSLMCQADTNLEYRQYDKTLDQLETPGWGEKHCRDFEGLFEFAEKWRVYNGKSPQERGKIEEDALGRDLHYDYVSSRGDPLPE